MKLQSKEFLASLTKEELAAMVLDFAKRWLAHDGLWFQSIEEKHGLDEAVEIDAAAWAKFAAVEARRIMNLHKIQQGGGLAALKKALGLRQYSFLTEQEIIDTAPDRFILRVNTCRVQMTRKRKGLASPASRWGSPSSPALPKPSTRAFGCASSPARRTNTRKSTFAPGNSGFRADQNFLALICINP